jgi:hypothetical protein
MAIRPDKNVLNEHAKFNTMDKYKAKAMENPIQVADISAMDISLSKTKDYPGVDLETAQMLSGNSSLTKKELNLLKESAREKKKVEATGKFKKD